MQKSTIDQLVTASNDLVEVASGAQTLLTVTDPNPAADVFDGRTDRWPMSTAQHRHKLVCQAITRAGRG